MSNLIFKAFDNLTRKLKRLIYLKTKVLDSIFLQILMQLRRCIIEGAQMQEDQLEEEVGLLRAGALSPAGQRSEVSHASQPARRASRLSPATNFDPRVRPLEILTTSFFLFLLERFWPLEAQQEALERGAARPDQWELVGGQAGSQ